MGRLGRLVRAGGGLLWLLVMMPALALPVAASLDVGPTGTVRLTAFPIALAILDPYVWECAWNSLAMAGAVTFASYVSGVGLGRLLSDRRFWGRRPLATLACAGMAVPPAFGAIGLRWAFGPSGWFASPGDWSGLGYAEGFWSPWLVWFWVASTTSAPVVGLATRSALRSVDPAWRDAALWAGASPRRAWRHLLWPVARPEVARALGAVFTLTLLEPGAPMVLGLRRTLGFQVVRSALAVPSPGELSRAAVLASLGTLLAIVGARTIRWWGGTPLDPPPWRVEPIPRTRPARWPVAALLTATLAILGLVAWLPGLALLAASLSGGEFAVYPPLFDDPLTRSALIHSAALGLAVLALDVVLARVALWASFTSLGRRFEVADWPQAVPPLAVGVGVLALAGLLQSATGPGGTGPSGVVSASLRGVARFLDPAQTPGVALLLAVAAVRLPMLARSVVAIRTRMNPAHVDAAVTLGASRGRALRWFSGGWSGASPGALALTFSLAATSVTPALILCPTAEARPVGPAVLSLADAPDQGIVRASALGTLAVAVNLAALAVAASPNHRRAHRGTRLPSQVGTG